MRKSYFAIIALGALVIASCQKENSAVLPKVDSPVFTATLDTDSDTKTELVERDGKKKSEWVSGDAIRVLNQDGDAAEYTAQNSGATATFTTTTEGFEGTEFIAMYPATPAKNASWDAAGKTVNKLSLKPEQKAVAGGYDPEAHIAVAYTETKTLDFLNAVSLLKFTCGSDNISEVCVYAIDNASVGTGTESKNVLSGYFNLNLNPEKKEVITATEDGTTNNYVKVTGALKKGQTYYIACLPTTFTNGFTVEVVSFGNKEAAKTTSKNYTLNRNRILDLGNVESTVETRTLYLETGVWNQDNPKYDAWIWGDGMSGTWVDFEVANGNILKTTIPNNTKGIKIYRRAQSMPSHFNEDNDKTRWNAVQLDINSTINSITITDWWAAAASDKIPNI